MATSPRKTPVKKAPAKKAPAKKAAAKTVAPIRPPLRTFSTVHRATPTHRFAVGQAVRLRGGFGAVAASAEIYRITATLPPRGASLQYRIRNEEERHERVTTEDDLEAVTASTQSDGDARTERTTGLGQGTAA